LRFVKIVVKSRNQHSADEEKEKTRHTEVRAGFATEI
jgi:hypothetical protein